MASFTNYLEDALLDHVFNNSALTSPATTYAAIFTVAPGEGSGGTEVSGSGYARQAISFGASSGGAIASTADVSFTASGGNFGSVVAFAIFDASTGGNMLAYDAITPKTIDDGDTLTLATGQINLTLD
ncbi:MAG: hypothetical protein AAFM92_03270 [Pseudomonadota bacterium]